MSGNESLKSNSTRSDMRSRCTGSIIGCLILTMAIALTPHVVLAGPRIMELQFETDKLVTLVRQRLAEETPCYLDEFELPTESGTFVLDHVGFPGGIGLQRSGGEIQLVVPVQIFTKTPECMRNPNCGLTDFQPNSPLEIDLVFAIRGEAMADSGGVLQPFMCIRFAGVELDGQLIPSAAAPGIYQALGSVAINKCNRINIDAVRTLLAGELKIKMVGASANSSLNRIALRIEFEDPSIPNAAPDPTWSAFFAGDLQPDVPGSEWSLFIDADMFTQTVVDRFTSEFTGKDRVSLTSAPEASWRPTAELGGRVDLALVADIDVDVCTIGTDADIEVAFRANSSNPNVVLTDGSLEIELDGGDLLDCSLLGGPLFPVLYSSAASLVSLISIEAILLGSSSTLPDECTQLGEEHFGCSFPVSLPRISLSKWNLPLSPAANMRMTTFFGDPKGPVLAGPMTTTPIPSHTSLSIESSGFIYRVQGGCSSLRLGWDCGVRMVGTGKLCRSIEVVDDPLGIFEVNWQGTHPLGNLYIGVPYQDFEVIFPSVGADIGAFNAAPYPCKLLFRTSLGSGTIAIPGPDESTLNPGESIGLLTKARANCFFEIAFLPGRMNPFWLVDPPPFDVQAQLLFENPSLQPESLTTELVDVAIVGIDAIGGSPDESGRTAVSNVGMQMEFNFRSRSGAVGGAPRTKRIDASDQTKPEDDMEFTIHVPVSVELVAKMKDGSLEGEAVLSELFSRVLDADVDQLPDGVRSASFFVEIEPDQLIFSGPLEIIPSDSGPGPAVDSGSSDGCGDGTCGAGSAFGMPMLMLGAWISRRRPRRRRAVETQA